jgi:2-methylcitrate dehydratase PrpD
MIESEIGWAQATTGVRDLHAVTDGLGERYEAALNTYKPFACGLVLHAAVTAALRVREAGVEPAQIAAVDVHVTPVTLDVANKTAPRNGLEAKLSVPHAIAVALIAGAAGEKEFRTDTVQHPSVAALRDKVTAQGDPALKPNQARVIATLADGRRIEEFAPHPLGSAQAPMSDADLDRKFLALASEVIPTKAVKVLSICRRAADLDSAAQLIAATRPD